MENSKSEGRSSSSSSIDTTSAHEQDQESPHTQNGMESVELPTTTTATDGGIGSENVIVSTTTTNENSTSGRETRSDSVSSSISEDDEFDETPEAVHRRHLRRLIYHHRSEEPEDEQSFRDMANALDKMSSEVDLTTEENNRLYSKRMDGQDPSEISAVRILKCGVWLDNDGLNHRIESKAEELDSTANQIQSQREKVISDAVEQAIAGNGTEKLLSVKRVTEEEKSVTHRYYETDGAAAVYEMAAFAIYLNHLIRSKSERIRTNEASSGTQINMDEETANIKDGTAAFIDHLDKLFHSNSANSDRVNRPYRQDIEHNANLAKMYYRRQLDLLDHRSYYNLTSFASQENYGRWFSNENGLLNERIADSDALLQSYKLRKRKKIVPREVKKAKTSIWSCCGIGSSSAAEQASSETPDPSHEENAKVDVVFIDSLTEQKFLDSYNLLLKIILQSDTSSSGMLHNVYEARTFQPHALTYPSGLSLQLLDIFADIYRVGPIYRQLRFAELLNLNPSVSLNHFSTCNHVSRELYSIWEHKSAPFTTPEIDAFKVALEGFSSWSRQCLTRYPLLFDSNTQPALKEALGLIKQSSRILAAVDTKRVVPPLNDQLREDYLKASEFYYSFLVKSSTLQSQTPVDKNSENMINTSEFEQFSISMTDPSVASLHIKSGAQLLLIINRLSTQLQQDLQMETLLESIQFSDASIKLAPITADYYLNHLWNDAQQFLQALASALDWKKIDRREHLHKFVDHLFVTIFSIHQSMSTFHSFIDRNVRSLSPVKIQSWFEPFVEQWLQRQKQKCDETYVKVLVNTDHFTPFNSLDQYSISVVTLFSELCSMHSIFSSSIPYNMRHAKHFAVLISDVTSSYCTLLHQAISRVLDTEDRKRSFWGLAQQRGKSADSELVCTIEPATFVKLNDIYIARKWCLKLLKDIDFSLSYDLTEQERIDIVNSENAVIEEPRKASHSGETNSSETTPSSDKAMWRIEEASAIQLTAVNFPAYSQCETTLNRITQLVPSLARKFATGLNYFVSNHLTFMVATSPSTDVWTKEKTNENYAHVLRFYSQHFSYMRLSLYASVLCEIIFSTLVDFCMLVERMIVHPRKNETKQRLRRPQIVRLAYSKELTLSFFVDQYAFPPHFMNRLADDGCLARLEYLLWLTQADSSKLVHEFQAIDEPTDIKNEKLSTLAREEYRLANTPYLSRSQLISILQFRVDEEKEGDSAVLELLKAYQPDKKGFFRKLFH